MLNRLWLLFCQAITVLLAAWFIVTTLKPGWITGARVSSFVDQVTLREAPDAGAPGIQNPGSFADAA